MNKKKGLQHFLQLHVRDEGRNSHASTPRDRLRKYHDEPNKAKKNASGSYGETQG